MIDDTEAEMAGKAVEGSDGKIGDVGQVYLDDSTGRPAWVTVSTGLSGAQESFVPVAEGELSGGALRVPYDKDTVKGAPRVSSDGHISREVEAELYRYYGLMIERARAGSAVHRGVTSKDRWVTETGPLKPTSNPTNRYREAVAQARAERRTIHARVAAGDLPQGV